MKHLLLTVSHIQKIDISIMFFRLCYFAAECLGDLVIKQRKNEQIAAKRGRF